MFLCAGPHVAGVSAGVFPPSDPVAWWPGDGTALDIAGNENNGTLEGGASYAPGMVGRAFSFNGGTSAVRVSSGYLSEAFAGLTVSAWVYATGYGHDPTGIDGLTIVSKTQSDGFALRVLDGYLQPDLRLTGGNVLFVASKKLPLNTWSHVAVTYDGTTVSAFLDGELVGTGLGSGSIANSVSLNTPVMIGNEPNGTTESSPVETGFGWNGLIDEPVIFNRSLSANEVAAIHDAGSMGMAYRSNPAPIILVQPVGEAHFSQETAELWVAAMGSPRPTYQWLFNGTPLDGRTENRLKLDNLSVAQAGDYAVRVTNTAGAITSATASLTVAPVLFLSEAEDFETGPDGWKSDSLELWSVGKPASGPGAAHKGENCLATVLSGNYPDDRTGRMVSPTVIVPAADQTPRLRFWHWWSISGHDFGKVQISADNGVTWKDLSAKYTADSSGQWTRATLDLSAYAGQSVRIGFYFETHGYNDIWGYQTDVGPGWYVDQVEVLAGPLPTWVNGGVESFEDPFAPDRWIADTGIWEIGKTSSGPAPNAQGYRAHEGANCLATILSGNYTDDRSSRIMGPVFAVPAVDRNPRLRFWHWWSIAGHDFGKVQISADNGVTWKDLSAKYTADSAGQWMRTTLDLGAYAGQNVRIGFYFESHGYNDIWGYQTDVGPGWYIDQVEIHTTLDDRFYNPENFESSWGDWDTDNNTLWQVGVPTAGPPAVNGSRAYSPVSVAATILGGNYAANGTGRLTSPSFEIPATVPGDVVALHFRHWYQYGTGDTGKVQISEYDSVRGAWSSWLTLSTPASSGTSTTWKEQSVDLSSFKGARVRLAFLHYANSDLAVGAGWYLDDLSISGLPFNPVDGACGAANGSIFTAAPATELCAAGTATEVTGSGPWNWSCRGLAGGADKNCGASNRTFTVTPAPGANGALSPATPQSANYNATIRFSVTPVPGYQIVSVLGCGGTLDKNIFTTGPITEECTVSAVFAANDIATGLVAWYPLNGNGIDASGNGRNGTVNGATPTTDRFGGASGAYDFDGATNDISIPSVELTTPVSVGLWFKSSAVNEAGSTLVGWNQTAAPFNGVRISANGDGKFRFRIGDDATDVVPNYIVDGIGSWHFAAMTRDETNTLNVFIDGTLVSSGAVTASQDASHPLYIGRSFQPGALHDAFKGSLDDLRIYNRALTAAEVRALYNLSASRLVVASNRAGNPDIWTMNDDGGSLTQLTNDGAEKLSPKWSPDGTRIAYVRAAQPSSSYELHVMNADGSGDRTVTTLAASYAYLNAWTPDGAALVYLKGDTACAGRSFRINLDGSNNAVFFDPFAGGTGWTPDLVFSADGSRVMWVSGADGCSPANRELYQAPYAGGIVALASRVRLTDDAKAEGTPSFSPDGNRVCVRKADGADGAAPPGNIYVMNGDGSNPVKVTNYAGAGDNAADCVWSPAGDKIAYSLWNGTYGTIVKTNPDGSSPANLTTDRYRYAYPDWKQVPMSASGIIAIDGACGAADGAPATAAPATALCSAGSASAFSGAGPWSWSCRGANGGTDVDCSAPVRTYILTFTAGDNGTLYGASPQTVNHGGSAAAVTAAPKNGYHFVDWSGTNGFATTADNPLTVGSVTADRQITANFAVNTYSVIPSAGAHGGISPAAPQTASHGAVVRFAVTPDTGYDTVTPLGGTCPTGSLAGTAYATGAVTADCTVIATFAIKTFSVTANAGANGSVSCNPAPTVDYGAAASCSIAPAEGYRVATFTDNGEDRKGAVTADGYTLAGVTASHTLNVTFELIPDTTPPTVAVTSPAQGAAGTTLYEVAGTASDNPSGRGVTAVEVQIYNGLRYVTATGTATTVTTWIPAATSDNWKNWQLDTANFTFMNTSDGTYTITARATDGSGNVSAPVSTTFTRGQTTGNQPPVVIEGAATSVAMSVDAAPKPFRLTLHAVDANGDAVVWSVVSPAGHGVAAATGTGTSIDVGYTPAPGYAGSDSFTIQASDGKGGTTTIAVFVTVAAPKSANLVVNGIPAAIFSSGVVVSGTLTGSEGGTPLAGKSVYLTLTSPSGSILADIVAVTNSSGAYSFPLNLATLDRAGEWGVAVALKNDLDYTATGRSASINIGKAETALTVSPSAAGVAPTGNVVISGRLSATLANAVSLAGLPVTVTLTDPANKTYTLAATTSDDVGRYSLSFNQFGGVTGIWTIGAGFAATANLLAAQAQQQTLNVAAASGYAILVQGDLNGVSRQSYTHSMDRVYKQLTGRFLTADNILYLSPEGLSHANVDAVTSREEVQKAITTWAYDRIGMNGDAPLTVVMIDHGGLNGKFYLTDDATYLTPDDVNGWLATLENKLKADFDITLKSVVVNGSCYSGSFMPKLVKAGRTVVTSSNADRPAAQGPSPSPRAADQTLLGDSFLHSYLDYLTGNGSTTLVDAFRKASLAVAYTGQMPLFDDSGTGSGKSYDQLTQDDGVAGKNVRIGLARSGTLVDWTVIGPAATAMLGSIPAIHAATTGDATGATDIVWAEVRKPSFVMPPGGTGQVDPDLPEIVGRYNQAGARWEFPADLNPDIVSRIFNETGTYGIIFHAADTSGEQVTPVVATAYINDPANRAPTLPQPQAPAAGDTLQEPLFLFSWSEAGDPDGDPVTYTLSILADSDGAPGTELKRYESIPQATTWLDAASETKAGGAKLFTQGSYWWRVAAVDGKGAQVVASPRKFVYTPQNGLIGMIYGKVTDASGAGVASATVAVGAKNYTALANGYFLIPIQAGTYTLSASKAGYTGASRSVTATSGRVVNASLSLAATGAGPGDCDGDGRVDLAELQSAVNMFLGVKQGAACVDTDGRGGVSVVEVQKAINAFLGL